MSAVDDYLEPFRLYMGGKIHVTNDVQTISGVLTEVMQDRGAPFALVVTVSPRQQATASGDGLTNESLYDVVLPWATIRSYRCKPTQ